MTSRIFVLDLGSQGWKLIVDLPAPTIRDGIDAGLVAPGRFDRFDEARAAHDGWQVWWTARDDQRLHRRDKPIKRGKSL